MPYKLLMQTSLTETIIGLFGGINAMARALGHRNASTVQGWKESGRIPRWRRLEVIAAAQRQGIALPQEYLRGSEEAA